MDIFERVKTDKDFARRVKVLRVHWACEEGELLDLMLRVFKTALPEFCALREFEWIGYPELRQDMVQFLLLVYPKLDSLGSVGFHFDACGISSFKTLKKLTLRAEDDDGYADWSEITTVLDNNSKTLKHLTLGAYLLRQHSWDATFSSPTIHNLTHLDLVDTRISHVVLSRIAHVAGGMNSRLESLTLHGVFEEPGKAAVVFGSDEVIDGEHTFLPRLKAFRFLLVGQPSGITPTQPPVSDSVMPSSSHLNQPHASQDHYDPTILQLYATVAHFLRDRTRLRRLDLGNCPWDLVAPLLPGLKGLRTIGVRIGCLSRGCGGGVAEEGYVSELDVLVKSLPSALGALRVEVGVSQLPLVCQGHIAMVFLCLISYSIPMQASFKDSLVFHSCTSDCIVRNLRFLLSPARRARMHCTQVPVLDLIMKYPHSRNNVPVVHRISTPLSPLPLCQIPISMQVALRCQQEGTDIRKTVLGMLTFLLVAAHPLSMLLAR